MIMTRNVHIGGGAAAEGERGPEGLFELVAVGGCAVAGHHLGVDVPDARMGVQERARGVEENGFDPGHGCGVVFFVLLALESFPMEFHGEM